jgi:DNA replication protein DnaC
MMLRSLSDKDFARLTSAYPEIAEDICPTCKGSGSYRWWGDEHVCDCATQKQLNVLYSHAGIGLTYQRLDWEDLALPEEALAPIRDYIEHAERWVDRGVGLFISGPLGTGKTLIANLVLKELVKKDYDCYFTTFSQTIESFTATWGSQENKEWFAERFMRSRVLCLDDLGREFRSSNKLPVSTFDHILRTRTQNSRPVILTTNLTPGEVTVGYGAAVLSLLLEQSIGVHLEGKDFRPRAHERTAKEVQQGEVRPIS